MRNASGKKEQRPAGVAALGPPGLEDSSRGLAVVGGLLGRGGLALALAGRLGLGGGLRLAVALGLGLGALRVEQAALLQDLARQLLHQGRVVAQVLLGV